AEWSNEAEKNAIVAEARFFRAYAHNILANLFGGVPIADEFFSEPKFDFVRASREDVYKFVAEDLKFASEWLPEETTMSGRIVKAAADHLLSEVYISLERYDDAISSASNVIGSGKYKLMTERFGSTKDEPGDVYFDLFKETNQNRSENTETIWAFQIEYNVPGGGRYRACRYWNCQYYNVKDPDGIAAMVLCDSLGRPNGWIRGTPYVYHGLWSDRNDMRCSDHNFRWVFYNNNPASKYFGQKIDPETYQNIDTMRTYYPTIRKMEGIYYDGPSSPDIYVDQYAMRLAETYLLRAEAYLKKGDLQKAADDVNVVRERANATPVASADVDMDFILDERMRELLIEEPRLLTLIRTGTLVDRVRKYHTNGGATIKDFHRLWPIPQTAIDANIGAKLEQNPGY
ncbi:MAG: RagB/SusD family nutrient uptake outer membrane protein, partial [Tannerella sp.]|nr:RagB/SusD family nutrient uptake outer membrane protein [Tannerella sp.]